MTQAVEITVQGDQGLVFAPVGLSSPAAECLGCTVTGGTVQHLTEASSGQQVLLVTPQAAEITFRYDYAAHPGHYPDAIFHPAPSRHTQPAPALVAEALHMAGEGESLTRAIRIARGVAEKFTYGHPTAKYYDGFDHVPHLTAMTEGSCVDIHTYLLAAFRGAGIEAGYVTGYFFPEDEPCTSGHCWAVTRVGGAVQEWDISHFLQIGRRDVGPSLNPKGGFRLPVGHSMGLSLPELGVHDLKLLVEPMVMQDGQPVRLSQKTIRAL
jgi:hypothetical protein